MDHRDWCVVQHVDHEGPALIARIGAGHGISFSAVRPDRGERLPRAEDVGGLVVMGGPMGVYEAGLHPYLAAEIELMRAAVERGRPVLGVCLGSQLLAAALGARVYRGPAPEIGPGEVELTAAGLADPVLGPAGPRIPVLHWHGDTFDLPPGAAHLARSAAYPHQAFRAGGRAYGFQFHVEVDAETAREWAPHLPAGARLDEPRRQAIERTGRAILDRFFSVTVTGYNPRPSPDTEEKRWNFRGGAS